MKYAQGSFITVPSRDTLRGLHPTAQVLYMWLCSYANETGNCFPSRKALAEDCGCSERTIDAMVDILTEKGLLEIRGRSDGDRQLSNLYKVIIVPPLAGDAIPPSTDCDTPLQNLRTNSIHLTQSTIGETAKAAPVVHEVFGGEDDTEAPKATKVIPHPFSVESTIAAWSDGEVRLQVLSWYFKESGLWKKATTRERLKAIMARHNRAAVRIANGGWTPKELRLAREKIVAADFLHGEWTLETVEKYLTK